MNDINNKFLEKRVGLELFVREQIVGPGAFNKRYFLLERWSNNEFCGKSLIACDAIDNLSEVITEVPAYQYSSAILFPEIKIEEEPTDVGSQTLPEGEDDDQEEEKPTGNTVDDEELAKAADHSSSVHSKNQNYPNTCGLAFAVNSKAKLENEVKITVGYRVYKRINQSQCREERLSIWLPENCSEIGDVINEFFSEILEVEIRDNNTFLCLKEGVDMNAYLYSIDYELLEKFRRDKVIVLIEKVFPDVRLFERTKKVYHSKEYEYTTLFEDRLYDEIKKRLSEQPSFYDTSRRLIHQLEVYNQVKELLADFKGIYKKSTRNSKPLPVWESSYEEFSISLESFVDDKKVQRGKVKVGDNDKLHLNYQYLRYNNDNIYVKLILVNKQCIYLKADEPQQLNKKNEANELSFFGVQLGVEEVKADILQPYNPPHLLEIDEEDSFNKLLYRQYKDYGEGYNASINWGSHVIENAKLRFVSTEFLPEQETPKVDYKPSKIAGGKVIPLINGDVLSLGNLSTLNGKNDAEAKDDILNKLGAFIDAYKVWIDEKYNELKTLEDVTQRKDLLERQLRACEKDYHRLKRNISLLKSDDQAMAAFRIMNTAMFLQLHHGNIVKNNKKSGKAPFIPDKHAEQYYIDLLHNTDYKWRAFQLGFILLNIDAFVRPKDNDHTVEDVFETGWPERNELADLVWFPTGGGKTEAYLGIIAFCICYRRFTQGQKAYGTTALMRYTLRLLTLQQFQRATLLICALEVIRKDGFYIPSNYSLGSEKITVGLYVGSGSLPNKWEQMNEELEKIADQLNTGVHSDKIKTNLPYNECPWCGGPLFIESQLRNVYPNPKSNNYGINDSLRIMCNSNGCTFNHTRPNENHSLPLRLFDEDIYKFPPTLLFGTVDKFAALANKISTQPGGRNEDSRRILGRGYKLNVLPPELIIQDELHLLLGPLGSAVGLFERAVDELCTYTSGKGQRVRPKIITSTATTRNTDKQIFAIFNRRSEIFPKQGISSDDSFFSFYERKENDINEYASNRKYIGVLPVGKTQVWMQLRLASISLAHRLKYFKERIVLEDIYSNSVKYAELIPVLDYYHTILSYFNSLKEVGKTQSQLSHYLPGDVNLVTKNTLPWSFLDRIIRQNDEIDYSELTGRLTGEEVKTNLSVIERNWSLLKKSNPPEFVISTNMISVGIDVSRFNTMIINSMPRNTAEYIQASSRVARDKEGVVFTVHHPFRSRDISHYQRFKEFHEKFYGYVEPISVTPYAYKSLDRFFSMYLAAIIRHSESLNLENNDSASNIDSDKYVLIQNTATKDILEVKENAVRLNKYLKERKHGLRLDIEGVIGEEEYADVVKKIDELVRERWLERLGNQEPKLGLKYRDDLSITSLFDPKSGVSRDDNWNVKQSLREIAPSAVVKTIQQ